MEEGDAQFAAWIVNLAEDEMLSGEGFEDEDWQALDRLRVLLGFGKRGV